MRNISIIVPIILLLVTNILSLNIIIEQHNKINSLHEENKKIEQELLDCLNGNAKWTTKDSMELIACEKAWTTKLK